MSKVVIDARDPSLSNKDYTPENESCSSFSLLLWFPGNLSFGLQGLRVRGLTRLFNFWAYSVEIGYFGTLLWDHFCNLQLFLGFFKITILFCFLSLIHYFQKEKLGVSAMSHYRNIQIWRFLSNDYNKTGKKHNT